MKCQYLLLALVLPVLVQAQSLNNNAVIEGTNNATDGGTLQLSTPSLSHFLRLHSGQNNDPRSFLYFNKTDAFNILSGTNDYLDIRNNLTLINALGTGSVPTTFVGINTANPLRELDIRTNHMDDGSEINLGNLDNSHFLRLFSGRQNQFRSPSIYWKHGDTLSFGTDLNVYTERLRITSDGKVGIGTKTPNAGLSIKLNSTGALPHIDLIEDEDVDYARLRLRNRTNATFWDIAANTTGDGVLNFFYSGFGNIMSLKNSGKVGIGQSSPLAKLHVLGSGGDYSGRFEGGNGVFIKGGTSGAPDLILAGTSAADDNGNIYSDPNFTSSDLVLYSNDDISLHLDENDDETTGAFLINNSANSIVFSVNEDGKVQSNGTIWTDVVKYNSPLTHITSVPSIAFKFFPSSGDTSKMAVNGNSGAYVNSGINNILVAPMQLPDGATISQFSCHVNDATFLDIQCELMAVIPFSNAVALASVASTSTPGNHILTDNTIANGAAPNATVDNFNYSYYVKIFSVGGFWSAVGSDLAVYKATVWYSLSQAQ